MKLILKKCLWIKLLLLSLLTATQAQNVSRKDCFPFENLPLAQRQKAEDLLLKALDGESLYTLIGGLKPMSSSFKSFQLQVGLPRIEFGCSKTGNRAQTRFGRNRRNEKDF